MKKDYSRVGLPDLLQTSLKEEATTNTAPKPVVEETPAVKEEPVVVEPAVDVVENKEEPKSSKKTK